MVAGLGINTTLIGLQLQRVHDQSPIFSKSFLTLGSRLEISKSKFEFIASQGLFSNFNRLKIKDTSFGIVKSITLNGDAVYTNRFFGNSLDMSGHYIYFEGCYFYKSATTTQQIVASKVEMTQCFVNSSKLLFRSANVSIRNSFIKSYRLEVSYNEYFSCSNVNYVLQQLIFSSAQTSKSNYDNCNISKLTTEIISPVYGNLAMNHLVISEMNSTYGLKFPKLDSPYFQYLTIQDSTFKSCAIRSSISLNIENLAVFNTKTGGQFFDADGLKLNVNGFYCDCDVDTTDMQIEGTNLRTLSEEMPKHVPRITLVPDPQFLDYRLDKEKTIRFVRY